MRKKTVRIILIAAVAVACWLQFPVGMHIKKTIPGKHPTCVETGLSEGQICKLCGKILTAQREIPVTNVHTYSDDFDKNCNDCSYIRETDCTFDFADSKVVLVDENQDHNNWRVVVYKLGTKTADDPADENALQLLDGNAKTHWGITRINEIQLVDPGNYVLLLKYNVGKSKAIKVPLTVTVKDAPRLAVDSENKVSLIENNPSNKNYVLTVYRLQENAVADLKNETDVAQKADSAQTYTGKEEIDALVITKGGDYVFFLHYEDANGAAQTVVKSETLPARPLLQVNEENRVVVLCDDDTVTNLRVFAYYLGDGSVTDIYDEKILKDAAGEPKAYWGLKQIGKAVLNEPGNYVIHLQYNLGTGPKKTVAIEVTIEKTINNDSPDGESLFFAEKWLDFS